MKKHASLLIIPSIIVNIVLGVFAIYNLTGNSFEIETLSHVKEAGIYGPSGLQVIEGDFTIESADVKLQNTVVTGNLYLTEGIGDGAVELNNVVVQGSTLVKGGGQNSIKLENVTLNELEVNREDGKVRVSLIGNTQVEKVILGGESILDVTELSEEGFLTEVYIQTASDVALAGDFKNIVVAQNSAQVQFLTGKADKLSTTPQARDAAIDLGDKVEIGLLEPGAPLKLTGEGLVKEMKVSAPGLVKVAVSIESLIASGRGIFIELVGGSIESFLVEESEGTVMIHLAEGTEVGSLELNGAAGITGKGEIKDARINAAGTTIEQTPGKVALAKDIKAEVGGKELPEKVEEKPPAPRQPSTPSTPSTPTVTLGSISNMSMGVGRTGTRDLSVSPGDANISVSSSNSNVASVSLSGNKITVTGNAAGSATITVTARKSGYNDRTRTFTVTVNQVRSFETGDERLSPGNTVVVVTLWHSDPQNYEVVVGSTPLRYLSDEKAFFGEVPDADASAGNVRVNRR
ncbi:Ig-like domain-containing protein [Dethiobacter alkaliphilus]|uniref:Ig domain protein group 2 domain protein n=1 Tax=Dethiobacter alkaliphilus AHT 1 TaxID=555088 RepID=C0GIC7_DETAL|nr:Ig-like domain-containing protein [Dethiobacter alkaliphilus]EEG76975.1 Ig domain protein group 2 domain protein [Dethiobacter alkaliphilus AHT 1]